MDILTFIQFPFVERALIAGVALGLVLAYLGVFAVLKRMTFFGDGIAHASLAGIAIGLLVGIAPFYVALVLSVFLAGLVYILEQHTELSSDAALGILFTGGMALGVLLLSMRSGYQPELVSFLFGNILAISQGDVVLITIAALAVFCFLAFNEKKLILLCVNPEMAYLARMQPHLYQLLLYMALAVSTVLGIKLIGIVLVSAFLVLPVSTARLFAVSFRSLFFWTVVTAIVTVVAGIFSSFFWNLPTGSAMVVTGTIFFISAFGLQRFIRTTALLC